MEPERPRCQAALLHDPMGVGPGFCPQNSRHRPRNGQGPHAGQRHLHRRFIIADMLPGHLFDARVSPGIWRQAKGATRSSFACRTETNARSGVSPSSISVYRWDNMHDNELVWDAEPENPITVGNISGTATCITLRGLLSSQATAIVQFPGRSLSVCLSAPADPRLAVPSNRGPDAAN